MELRLGVDGQDADLEALWDWLSKEDPLRGHVRFVPSQATPREAMGVSGEVAVQIAATVAGAGALWVTVARSICTFLIQRRSDISITAKGPDGRLYSIKATRVRDPEALARTFQELARPTGAQESE